MEMTMITIPLDQETARIYNDAPEDEKRKIELLLKLFFKDFIASPHSLPEIMDEIGNNAEKRGLTSEILKDLLKDE